MDGSYDFSPDYRYRGHFFTDADGEFVMETIIPGVYPGRTPHIHIKVEGANTPLLTTQLYFPDHPLNPADLFYDADLEVTPIEWLPSGGLVASFEFNLSSDCTAPTVASDPESSSYPEGDVAVLSIEATGSEVLEFRWRRDGVELADGGAWVGTGTDTLTIVDVAPSHAGTYDCLVSNACGATASEAAVITVGAPESFVRGDCSADGDHDLGDPITLLDSVFSGGTPPGCADACDGNDDGTVDVADAVFLLSFLFSSGPDPAAPFPDCGDDLTSDLVGCHWYAACP